MTRLVFFPFVFLVAFGLSFSLWAQAPVPQQDSGDPVDAEGEADADSDEEKPKKNKKEDGEEEEEEEGPSLLESLSEIQFDRRPSVILKTIAEENAPPPDPEAVARAEAEKAAEARKNGGKEKKVDPKVAAMQAKLEAVQKSVTLGRWEELGSFLKTEFVKPAEHKQAWMHVVGSLSTPIDENEDLPPQFLENHEIGVASIIGLTNCAPENLDDKSLRGLSKLLAPQIKSQDAVDLFVGTLKKGTIRLGGDDPEKRRLAAKLLAFAGRPLEAVHFLPTEKEAREAKDFEGLNLLAKYHLARQKRDGTEGLEAAWQITEGMLNAKGIEEKVREMALERALDLAGQVRKELGETWLEDNFLTHPERGQEILTGLGAASSAQRAEGNPNDRFRRMRLQYKSVSALFTSGAEITPAWKEILDLLSDNWLREAEHSRRHDRSQSRGPRLRYDDYGNVYYANDGMDDEDYYNDNGSLPGAISSGKLLEVKPGPDWIGHIAPTKRGRFDILSARLLMKLQEEDEAFPYIEKICKVDPEEGQKLANEFLKTWTRNHDPNSSQRMTNPYMYSYGYNPRAEGIPLTRSKQERNLKELAEVVARLKTLPLEEGVDEALLSDAFVNTHSSAEVYKLSAIETVFGDIAKLEPKTLAGIATRMRANLLTSWRDAKVQKQAKTKRTDPEMLAEVARGYGVAQEVLQRGLEGHPDSPLLLNNSAALMIDINNFGAEFGQSSGFVERRDQAFEFFRKAAAEYARQLPEMDRSDESSEVFDTWFTASLGASVLGALKAEHQPDPKQAPLIREAILALPEEAAERHMARFANNLSTRMTGVGPELKQRYLRQGLEIAGDHERAADARDLMEYYKDLITEIELAVDIDGSDSLSADEPFGLFVNIRHTVEVERESDGFGKYLQNQNNMGYGYNYGRPPENYRDKFEGSARAALEESFEVVSITFHKHEINSRVDPEPGWKMTPYAYILLKPKGAQIDAIPPLQLDLDFLDTSGFVVLPIASAEIPIDASGAGKLRPFENLQLIQTLDERDAAEGQLRLEVKTVAQGLIPPVDQLLTLDFPGYEIAEIEDQGVQVVELNPDAERQIPPVVSERSAVVKLQSPDGDPATGSFHFAPTREGIEVAETTYQRYDDADLEEVEAEMALAAPVEEKRPGWTKAVFSAILVLAVLAGIWFLLTREDPEEVKEARYQRPREVNSFTVIGLLRQIRDDNHLARESREELEADIAALEDHYYGEAADEEDAVDLEAALDTWLQRAA